MAQAYDGLPRSERTKERGPRRLEPQVLGAIRRHLASRPPPRVQKKRVTAPESTLRQHVLDEHERRPTTDDPELLNNPQRQVEPENHVRADIPPTHRSRTKHGERSTKSSKKSASNSTPSKTSSSSKSRTATGGGSSEATGQQPATRHKSPRRAAPAETSRGHEKVALTPPRPTTERTKLKSCANISQPSQSSDENKPVDSNRSSTAKGSASASASANGNAPRRRHTTSPSDLSASRSAGRLPSTQPSKDEPKSCSAWCRAQPREHDEKYCVLLLNQVSEEDFYAFCEYAPKLGRRSAHRILVERAANGPFLSAVDFDRRLERVTFGRLSTAAEAVGARISLDITPRLMSSRTEAGCSIVATMVPVEVRSKEPFAPQERTIRVATWNAAHFSAKSQFRKEKTANLVRFVRSDRPTIIALQEVYSGVPTKLAHVLSKVTGSKWRCTDKDSVVDAGGGALRQSFLYDEAFVRGSDITSDVPRDTMNGFLRAPCVAQFDCRDETLVMVNVHLSTRFKEGEVQLLPSLVRGARVVLASQGLEEDRVICVGDFNVSSDAQVFQGLREEGLIEIVRPPEPGLIDNRFLRSPTTVGGEFYDNFFFPRSIRDRVQNGWVFDFGGRGVTLGESKLSHAGSRRAKRSDHYVLVTELSISISR